MVSVSSPMAIAASSPQRAFPDMKRSSLRALLYLEKKSGNIDQHGGRYVLKQDKPSAPTLGLSQ